MSVPTVAGAVLPSPLRWPGGIGGAQQRAIKCVRTRVLSVRRERQDLRLHNPRWSLGIFYPRVKPLNISHVLGMRKCVVLQVRSFDNSSLNYPASLWLTTMAFTA